MVSTKRWSSLNCSTTMPWRIRQSARRQPSSAAAALHVESEIKYITILDHVIRTFQPHLARLFRALLAALRDKIGIGDGLGADEALLEIGMNRAGRLRRLGALRHRPGMRLLGPDREEGDEVEQPIARMDDARQARLGEAKAMQELALLRHVGELRHFGLDGGGDDDAGRALRPRIIRDARRLRVALGGGALLD